MSETTQNQQNNDSIPDNKQGASSAQVSELKRKRDDLNAAVKGLISESKITYSALEKLRNDIKQKKGARDEENSMIQKLKAERDKLNEALKTERTKLNVLRDELKNIKMSSSASADIYTCWNAFYTMMLPTSVTALFQQHGGTGRFINARKDTGFSISMKTGLSPMNTSTMAGK